MKERGIQEVEEPPGRHADIPTLDEIKARKKAGTPILKPPNRAERRAVKYKRGSGGAELNRAAVSGYVTRFREIFGAKKKEGAV